MAVCIGSLVSRETRNLAYIRHVAQPAYTHTHTLVSLVKIANAGCHAYNRDLHQY